MITTQADTTATATDTGFIATATPDEYAARTAKTDEVRGYFVPGFLL